MCFLLFEIIFGALFRVASVAKACINMPTCCVMCYCAPTYLKWLNSTDQVALSNFLMLFVNLAGGEQSIRLFYVFFVCLLNALICVFISNDFQTIS